MVRCGRHGHAFRLSVPAFASWTRLGLIRRRHSRISALFSRRLRDPTGDPLLGPETPDSKNTSGFGACPLSCPCDDRDSGRKCDFHPLQCCGREACSASRRPSVREPHGDAWRPRDGGSLASAWCADALSPKPSRRSADPCKASAGPGRWIGAGGRHCHCRRDQRRSRAHAGRWILFRTRARAGRSD